jgi:hypothetical protein
LINFKKNDVPSHVLISIACSGDSKQWGYENHKKNYRTPNKQKI